MKKIAVTTTSFGKYDEAPLKLISSKGFELVANPYGRKLQGGEIVALCKDAIGVVAGTEKLSGDVLKQLTSLKVVSRCGVGLDSVDLEAAKRLGIKVLNTPDGPTQAVAELTIGLMLDCLRGLSGSDRLLRLGTWHKHMGRLLRGKTVGIIGYGRIGQAVAKLVDAFGAKVLAYDIAAVADAGKAEIVSFEELIRQAEVITLHTPPSKSEKHLIDTNAFARMKKGSFLINASRGGVVDELALYEALKSGKLAGAAIDVFEQEPYEGRLRELDNVVLTPHIGSYAREARIEMEKQAVENLLKGLEVES